MSDEMKNHCPPETTAPAMHAHDATSKTEDIKPKMISTAHKRLSQDEFQRKVAMAAYIKAAEDMGLSEMEKEAFLGAVLGLGRAALRGGLPLFTRYLSRAATAGGAKTWGNLIPRAMMAAGKSKMLAPLTAGAGQAKTWANLPTRIMFGKGGLGSAAALPLTHPGYAALTSLPLIGGAMPYIGGGLQRLGGALGGAVGAGSGQAPGMSNVMNSGLIGAGIGALGGALMPGQEEYEDEDGRIRKRSRGMLAGALRGAGMGGLAGGAVGAGMDYFGKQSDAHDFGAALAAMQKEGVSLASPTGGAIARAALNPSLYQNVGKAVGRVGQQVGQAARRVAQNPVSTAANVANAAVNPVGAAVGAGANLAGRLFR